MEKHNFTKLLFENNAHHLDALLQIVTKQYVDTRQPGFLEGNAIYDNCTTNPNPLFHNKQTNIFNISTEASSILEVGVNAGHSILIMLLANSTSNIYAFDICTHTYTIPCVEYLNKHFNNRIRLFVGDSRKTLPEFIYQNPGLQIDLFHVDGLHEPDTDIDFKNCYALAKNDSIMIWDDSENSCLNSLWKGYIETDKTVVDITNKYLDTSISYYRQHTIGLLKKY